MEIKAELNYLRIAPRKVRSVAKILRGLDVDQALAQLTYMRRKSVVPILKLVNSAIANARNNKSLSQEDLYIKEIKVDEGAKLKRYMPKGFGRTSPIQKKTSHISIVLDELSDEKKKTKKKFVAKAEEKAEELKKEEKQEVKLEKKKDLVKPQFNKKETKKGFLGGSKKMFRRKSI